MKKSGPVSNDALDAALRLLGVRQRSVFELAGKLKDKGFSGDDIDRAIERLKEAGYLDDEAFAKALASSRARNKSWGPAKIAQDLLKRGIDKETVRGAVALACPEEEGLAKAALEKWLRRNKGLSDRQEKEKAFRHLSARGFSPSAIWKAFGRQADEDGQD